MKGIATTIQPDGTITTEEFMSKIGLEAMQKAVGGYIETIPHFNVYKDKPCVAFCNEEGKLQGLAFNCEATVAWNEAVGMPTGDPLVGPIIILQGDAAFMRSL